MSENVSNSQPLARLIHSFQYYIPPSARATMLLSCDKVTSLAATLMEELAIVAAIKRILAIDFMFLVCVLSVCNVVEYETKVGRTAKMLFGENQRATDLSPFVRIHYSSA